MQKITPFLWFDSNAEEAANFYTSIFKNSKILNVSRYGEAGPGPKGSAMTVTFELRRATIHGVERRSALHFYSSHIVLCKLRDASRS